MVNLLEVNNSASHIAKDDIFISYVLVTTVPFIVHTGLPPPLWRQPSTRWQAPPTLQAWQRMNVDVYWRRRINIYNSSRYEAPCWRHEIETFSALLALGEGNPSVTGIFPSQRPLTWSFDVFFDLHLNKQLSKHSRRRWFEIWDAITLIMMPL